MKRILGFLVGAGLGVLIAYSLRKVLSRSSATPAPVEIPAPKNNTVVDPPQSFEKVTTKFTVRRTGPRPQSPTTDTDTSLASADGHPAAADSKKEVEQTLQEAIPAVQVVEEVPNTEPVEAETPVETFNANPNQDDFTILDDIGPIFNTKLHNSGVHTFAELAALSSEEIADRVGTNAARVERFQWREQATSLASDTSNASAEETKAEG